MSQNICQSEILIFEGEKKVFSMDNPSSVRPFQQMSVLAMEAMELINVVHKLKHQLSALSIWGKKFIREID